MNRKQLHYLGGAYAVLVLLSYTIVYYLEPFGEFFDQVLRDSLTVLVALACTFILLLVLSFYQHGEPPRRIWIYFAIALGLWTLGELVWGIYDVVAGEVPDLSIADGAWAIGYVFFTLALVSQYRLIFFDTTRKPTWVATGIWFAALALTSVVLALVKSETFFVDFLLYFYPFGDLAVGITALIMVIKFRRGSLARPWLSLFAFVFSDSLYIWAVSYGAYDWTGASENTITLIVELVYMAAYLFMGWGLLQQYITLRFGASTKLDTNPLNRVKK
ncbi:MAG: hypothetical protein EHM81_02890 [Chloroflexi bacterium]|nr:MAG: hypothetical protein EHM81_02890 [Chloroflexota bacterium]